VLTKTESIVLKTQKYSEADLIVNCLTPDRGIISAFAKSPRKTKSRFGSSLEPLTHAKISLWGKEQSMPKITQSDIINSFHEVRENFHDFVNVSKLTEIIIALMPEASPNKKIFSFFLSVLSLIKSSEDDPKDALYLIAQARLLAIAGYAPRLNGCGKCGRKSQNFYPASGAILCGKCASSQYTRLKEAPVKITDRTLGFYTHSIEWPMATSRRLKPHKNTITELSAVLDMHMKHLLNKKLNSSEFLAGAGGK
jgi:DNA repair protein RecO (recombination protein O)